MYPSAHQGWVPMVAVCLALLLLMAIEGEEGLPVPSFTRVSPYASPPSMWALRFPFCFCHSLQTSLGVLPVVNNSRAGGWHLSLCLHPQGPHYLLVARLPFKDCGLSRLHSGFPWSEASSYHPHWVGGCGWQSFSSSFMGPDERSPVA